MRRKLPYSSLNLQKLFEMKPSMFMTQHTTVRHFKVDGSIPDEVIKIFN
jgi:hypothetical protein